MWFEGYLIMDVVMPESKGVSENAEANKKQE